MTDSMGHALNQHESAEEKFDRFLEHARKNNKARKHHVVPASYLSRWAAAGMLQVTDLMTGDSRPMSPDKAARITDFYRVEAQELDAHDYPPLLIENLLGHIEGRARPSFDALLAEGVQRLSDKARLDIAMFMGYQYLRGQRARQFAQQAAESMFRMQYADLAPEAVREMLKARGKEGTEDELARFGKAQEMLKQGKIRASPQKAALVGPVLL